jgi:hypothetical protein
MGMQHAVTSPTYLLHGLIAKRELRELLDLLYDERAWGTTGGAGTGRLAGISARG